MIQEACDKTVMTTDNHRFAYADGILTKWYQAGVRYRADIPAADASYKRSATDNTQKTDNIVSRNKFNSFAQNSYDFNELEQNILSN